MLTLCHPASVRIGADDGVVVYSRWGRVLPGSNQPRLLVPVHTGRGRRLPARPDRRDILYHKHRNIYSVSFKLNV